MTQMGPRTAAASPAPNGIAASPAAAVPGAIPCSIMVTRVAVAPASREQTAKPKAAHLKDFGTELRNARIFIGIFLSRLSLTGAGRETASKSTTKAQSRA